jgi:D-alanyl-D-alanine dipeptidase
MLRAIYVANPENGGSMYYIEAIVDITLVKLDGNSIDVGTSLDFFGKEVHIDNSNISNEILKNRNLLFEGMRLFDFQILRT